MPATLTSWVTSDQVAADGRVLNITFPTGVTWDQICVFASTWLFYQSGQRFGQRVDTIRPGYDCTLRSQALTWGAGTVGGSVGTTWFNRFFPEGGLDRSEPLNEIVLPGNGPINPATVTVTVDGVTLTPQGSANEQWHLYDGRRLVRTIDPVTKAALPWPTWQMLAVPLGQPGTLGVTYTHGTPVGPDAVFAAQELAVQIGLIKGNKATKLPATTSRVVRQGVTLDLVTDPALRGFASLPIVKDWLAAVNPNKLRRQASIRSVDSPRANVT